MHLELQPNAHSFQNLIAMNKLAVVVLLFQLLGVAAGYSCLNANNAFVDWFIFYKFPKMSYGDSKQQQGDAFIYMDSGSPTWSYPDLTMADQGHAIYNTLQQFYNNKDNTNDNGYILYNDEFPDSTVWSETSGHQKGVVLTDQNAGFWLIHSIPKFPSNQSYAYPSNAYYYGQIGICVSFNYTTLGTIAHQLYYTAPFTYTINFPASMIKDYGTLQSLINNNYHNSVPYTTISKLTSTGGLQFTHFAKSGGWGRDIYHDLIAPTAKTDLLVQSWTHATNLSNNMNSTCTGSYSVYDAKHITTPNGDFTSYEDHSKYAVSFSSSGTASPYACIADNNRQFTQTKRGGGALCFTDSTIYSQLQPLISQYYPCLTRANRFVPN